MKKIKKIKKVCSTCGSEQVLIDAWSSWNFEKQEFELVQEFGNGYCEQCDEECKIDDIIIEEE